jgi:hypothetical protein
MILPLLTSVRLDKLRTTKSCEGSNTIKRSVSHPVQHLAHSHFLIGRVGLYLHAVINGGFVGRFGG